MNYDRYTFTIDDKPWNEWEGFGKHSLSKDLFYFIALNFNEDNVLLEMGSGRVTALFDQMFKKVYSVEDQPEWLNKYHSNYIHSPIIPFSESYVQSLLKAGVDYNIAWYDPELLKEELETHNDYNFILIDGPCGIHGRYGFSKHIDIFKTDVPMIFDDVNRPEDVANYNETLKKLNKTGRIYKCSDGKMFGVVNWENLPNIDVFTDIEIS